MDRKEILIKVVEIGFKNKYQYLLFDALIVNKSLTTSQRTTLHPCLLKHFLICSSGMNIIETVLPALPYIQIILSTLLVTSILLQQRGSSLGGAFGGDNFSSAFHQRRGAELFLFKFSTGAAILFVIATFLNILA